MKRMVELRTMKFEFKRSQEKSESILFKKFMRDRYLLLLLIPGVLYFIVFQYLPMGGLLIAFKDYSIHRGIWESPWVGLDNFKKAFASTDFWYVLRNTIVISTYKLIFGFPAPIILSLFLNELRSRYFKRVVQTVLYLPHFISWVVIAGILVGILSPSYGLAGPVFKMLGMEPIHLMASTKHFRGLLVASEIWKNMGWGTIVYLAALSNIDPSLYESAVVDGANKLMTTIYITLPSISSVIILLLIIRIGNLLDAGFEQVLVMQNDLVRPISDIFQTFVYRRGLERGDYSYATAVEFFNSAVALILIVSADRFAKFIGEEGLI